MQGGERNDRDEKKVGRRAEIKEDERISSERGREGRE